MSRTEKIESIEVGKLVEVSLNSGIKLVGILVSKTDNEITIDEPCAAMAAPMPNQQTGSMNYITTMMPFRAVGDENVAIISYSEVVNISYVSLPNYVQMWENNIKEYKLMWNENGTRDLTQTQTTPEAN
jgi:hypothetical protein